MNYGGYGSPSIGSQREPPLAGALTMLSAEQVQQIQLQHQTLQAKRQALQAEMQRAMQVTAERDVMRNLRASDPDLANGIAQQIQQTQMPWGTLPTAIPIEANVVAWMTRNGYNQPNRTTFDVNGLEKLLSSIAEQSADRARAEMSELAQRHALEQQTMAHPRESIADEWMRRR